MYSSNWFSGNSNKLLGAAYQNLGTWDICMAYMGFGAIYFKIKSWSEVDDHGGDIYTKLSVKHKIWTVMFEVFPSLGLQIYASVVEPNTELSMALTASIIFSCLNASFTVWMYMVDLQKVGEINDANPTQSDANSAQVRQTQQ